MPGSLALLMLGTVGVAALHTLSGPDHYLPFIALSRSRGWSARRTLFWVLLCGGGHVGASVLLALGGAAIGASLSGLHGLEDVRGGIAGWALLLFGLGYGTWGLLRLRTGRRHRHFELIGDEVYVYQHREGEPVAPQERHRVTPWVLFIVFLLGPCEPMIPLLYLPAVRASWWVLGALVGIYTAVTLVTMATVVWLAQRGLRLVPTDKLERYLHPLSGGAIAACGAGMLFLGW